MLDVQGCCKGKLNIWNVAAQCWPTERASNSVYPYPLILAVPQGRHCRWCRRGPERVRALGKVTQQSRVNTPPLPSITRRVGEAGTFLGVSGCRSCRQCRSWWELKLELAGEVFLLLGRACGQQKSPPSQEPAQGQQEQRSSSCAGDCVLARHWGQRKL